MSNMDTDVRPDITLGRRSPMAKTRIVVADRNVITRVGLRSILERNTGMAVVAADPLPGYGGKGTAGLQ